MEKTIQLVILVFVIGELPATPSKLVFVLLYYFLPCSTYV